MKDEPEASGDPAIEKSHQDDRESGEEFESPPGASPLEESTSPAPNTNTTTGTLNRLREPISPVRMIALVFLIAPIAGLGVARFLTPDADGLGTHRQLGLPPCSMRVLFGIRCPGCGMTTSWAHFTRGSWSESVAANVAGFLLAWFAIWIAFLAARTVYSERAPGYTTQTAIAITAGGIFLVALTQWAYRLWSGV